MSGETPEWSPAVLLTEVSMKYAHTAALRAVALLNIADHLGDGPLPVADLAARSGAEPQRLHRILRLLSASGVFSETGDGTFGLTDQSRLLRVDDPESMREAVLMVTDETFWLPALRLRDTAHSGTTVFPDLFGTSFFDFLAAKPDGAAAFAQAMAQLSDTDNDPVAERCPVEEGTLVEVGGGQGRLLRMLLARHPRLRGVLFDTPDTVAALPDSGLGDRFHAVGGDFFTAVPEGGDTYLMKRILHDWDDEHALRILTSVRRAMGPRSRLLVAEALVPEGADAHPVKTVDVVMMLSLDGAERSETEWRNLFTRAGLTLTRTVPTRSTMTILEAVPTE
jgi:O-methyltransferase domain